MTTAPFVEAEARRYVLLPPAGHVMFLHPFFWAPLAASTVTASRVAGEAAGGQSGGLTATLITTGGALVLGLIGLYVQVRRDRENRRNERRIEALEEREREENS